jgi:hypothetical protein
MSVHLTAGQQHLGLDAHERRNEEYELACQFYVERLEFVDIFQKLVGDGGDRNVIYIQLVALNEEQEEVERTFELRQFYLV